VTPLTIATSFIHIEYKPWFFWFEGIEIMRKGYFVGFSAIIFTPGTIAQLVSSVLIALTWLFCLTSFLRPFKFASDNLVVYSCTFMLTAFLLLCFLFQTDAFIEQTEGYVASATIEQYSIDSAVFSGVTILAVISILAFVFILLIVQMVRQWQKEQHMLRWALPTMNPPYFRWLPRRLFCGFLSHVKVEAASDARYIADLLRKMLLCPAFLDAASLTDLRELFEHGVQKSDVIIVMASRSYLTRPWCLLELLEATRRKLPVVRLELHGHDFNVEEARAFIGNLEVELPQRNELAMLTISDYLGTNDLTELKAALVQMLDAPAVQWNATACDEQMLAHARELCETMARLAGQPILWSDEIRPELQDSWTMTVQAQANKVRGSMLKRAGEYGAVILCNRENGAAHSRAMQSELSLVLEKPVLFGTDGKSPTDVIKEKDVVVVLMLTQGVLDDKEAMGTAAVAVEAGRLLVPVLVVGSGYAFHQAHSVANLEFDEIELRQMRTTREQLKDLMTNTIAIEWRPDGGENMARAAIAEIKTRMRAIQQIQQDASKRGRRSSRLTVRRTSRESLSRRDSSKKNCLSGQGSPMRSPSKGTAVFKVDDTFESQPSVAA